MRLKFETLKEKCKRLERWHKWFAWHPITLDDGTFVWLETVERYKKHLSYGFESYWITSYREVTDE